MKKYIVFGLLMTAAATMLVAQIDTNGVYTGKVIISSHQGLFAKTPYDGKTPPPLKLDEAYMKALSTLGDATNQYYCVSATAPNHIPRYGIPGQVDKGWMFAFSSTNGTSRNVYVYFDKTAPAQIEDPAKKHSGF